MAVDTGCSQEGSAKEMYDLVHCDQLEVHSFPVSLEPG